MFRSDDRAQCGPLLGTMLVLLLVPMAIGSRAAGRAASAKRVKASRHAAPNTPAKRKTPPVRNRAATAANYSLTLLNGLTRADAVAANGAVVGQGLSTQDAPHLHAFKWQNGAATDLDVAGRTSEAVAINAFGQIALTSSDASSHVSGAFVVGSGGGAPQALVSVDPNPADNESTYAAGINASGKVCGGGTKASFEIVGAYWDDALDLREIIPSDAVATTVTGIADQSPTHPMGQVAINWLDGTGNLHGGIWEPAATPPPAGTVVATCGTLGGTDTMVNAINDESQLVGKSRVAGGSWHAFQWSSGTMTDLGTLSGTSSEAHALNNNGQVVGEASVSGSATPHAFLWSSGTMQDLNSLMPSGSGITLDQAFGINDAGQIVGNGHKSDNGQVAFLLSPATGPPPPPQPTNLVADAVSSSEIDLSWSESATVDGFRLYRGTSQSNLVEVTGSPFGGTVTSFRDTNLTPSTTYVYDLFSFTTSNGTETDSTAATASASTPALPAPILTISKALTPAVTQANPGDTLTYTLTYSSSSGAADLTNPTVVDPLPEGTTFTSAFFLDANGQETSSPVPGPNGRNPEFANGNITWYLGSGGAAVLPSGASGSLKLNVQVNATGLTQSSISNANYTIQGTAPGGSLDSATGPTVTVPVSAVQATITASPGSVAPGGTITYTETVTNGTPSTIQNVTLTDPVPTGTTLVSAPGSTVVAGTQNLLSWNLGTIQPGKSVSETMTVQVAWDPDLSDPEVDNSGASVAYLDPGGHRNVNIPPVSTPIVGTATNPPRLGLTIRAATASHDPADPGNTAIPGEVITYSIDYFNTGGAVAKNVVLADAAPIGGAGAPYDIRPSRGATYDPQRKQIRWVLGDLEPGGPSARGSSGTVTFKVRAPRSAPAVVSNGFFSLTASNLNHLTNGTPNPFVVDIVDKARFFIEVRPNVSAVPASAGTNQHVLYNVDFINTGGGSVRNVTITDAIPSGTQFVRAGSGGTLANGVITWKVPLLKAKKWQNVQLEVETTTTSGVISDQATIQGGIAATLTSAPAVTPITPPGRPFVQISAPMSLSFGDSSELVYTIVYGNHGAGTAHNVQLTDTLPAGTSFVSADSGGTQSGAQVVWSLGDLEPSSAGAVTLTVTVSGPGRITNTDCRISSADGATSSVPGRDSRTVSSSTDRFAGSVTTTVRQPNALFALWEGLGNFLQTIGGAIGNFLTSIFSKPQLGHDVSTIQNGSLGTSVGGADIHALKVGVTITPLGNGQVLVQGPSSAITNGGTSLIGHDGGSIWLVGDSRAVSINVGGSFGTLTASDVLQRWSALIAAGGGNIIAAGGGNLINQDGAGIVSNDGGSLTPIATANTSSLIATGGGNAIVAGGGVIAGTGAVSGGGSSLINQDGAGVISHDGGTIVQINSGYLISSQRGTSPSGGG